MNREDEIYRKLMVKNSKEAVPDGWGRTQLEDEVIVTKPSGDNSESKNYPLPDNYEQPFNDLSKDFSPSVPLTYGVDSDPDILDSRASFYDDLDGEGGSSNESDEPHLQFDYLKKNNLIPDWLSDPSTGKKSDQIYIDKNGIWRDWITNTQLLSEEEGLGMNEKIREIYNLSNME